MQADMKGSSRGKKGYLGLWGSGGIICKWKNQRQSGHDDWKKKWGNGGRNSLGKS